MLLLILFLGGAVLGALIGRWWAVLAAVGVGAWIALAADVDKVSPVFLGVAYAALAAAGIALGVAMRRRAPARAR